MQCAQTGECHDIVYVGVLVYDPYLVQSPFHSIYSYGFPQKKFPINVHFE